METSVPPAVAGTFYEGNPGRLRKVVRVMLDGATREALLVIPRMLIVPHAGHIYSGPVAASAYVHLEGLAADRIGLVGPSHYLAFDGVAVPGRTAMETPLGTIPIDPIDQDLVEQGVAQRSFAAYQREHSLEVQLPFLQVVLERFTVTPVLTGDEDPDKAAQTISIMLDAGLFVVISSDLSHYHDHETATRLDTVTAGAIVELRHADLGRNSACGRTAVRGALRVAEARGWTCELLDLRTSADTAGDPHRVVGYGAFAIGSD